MADTTYNSGDLTEDYTSTPLADYSTVVPPSAQAKSNQPEVSALNSFLTGLAGVVTPVAQSYAAITAAKNGNTTNTGDGLKALPVVQTTPTGMSGINLNSSTLLIGGAVVVGIIAILIVTRGRS